MGDFQDKMVPVFMTLMMIVGNVYGQSSSVCTGPMMRSFNSCISFLAGGSNASSPTAACCRSLRDLMSNGQDCLCLIVTGGVPFQVPINRSLAISLPKACRQSGVPVQCKGTISCTLIISWMFVFNFIIWWVLLLGLQPLQAHFHLQVKISRV